MMKFSMRALPAAVAMTAMLAFSAHAQVREGTNSNIDNDVRAHAGVSVDSSVRAGTSTDTHVNSDGTVKRTVKRAGNAVKRTGHKVEGAVDHAADATRSGAYRAKGAVGNVAAKANRGIQNHLPGQHNAGPAGQVNVEGSGNLSTGSGVARPPQ